MRIYSRPTVAFFCLLTLFAIDRPACLRAQDEIIVVTTSHDANDFGGQQTVEELPGPDGLVSFREACTAANNTTGPQSIHFAIPTSDWHPLSDEMALLRLEDGAYSITGDGTTVDFSTQTLFTGDTNPNGMEVGIYGLEPNGWGVPAIFVLGNNCRIIGLGNVFQRGYAVSLKGNNNRIEACVINGTIHDSLEIDGGFDGPPATGNIIGGVQPGQSNRLESLLIAAPANENVVIGNIFDGDGIRIAAAPSLGLFAVNNRIGGPEPGEGNILYSAGYYSSEGFPTGANISLSEAENTLIQGNTLGLLADGLSPASQVGPTGIEVRSSPNTTLLDNTVVGMKTTGINHASGQTFGRAIAIHGPSNDTIVQRNLVGINRLGQPIANYNGIVVDNFQGAPSNVLIGGSAATGNTIAHSNRKGISVHALSSGVQIRGNQISNSGDLGIDLNGDGITLNDNLDTDAGANGLQNYPTLQNAVVDSVSTVISGAMSSAPHTEFAIEFFANSQYGTTGFGEGEFRIGEITVTTDAAGTAAFEAGFPVTAKAGYFISGTATDLATGNTSEFAPSVEVESTGIVLGDINLDGHLDLLDVAPFIDLLTDGTYQPEADINQDGGVDLLDVQPFIDLLTG